jgi:hypothetical protein
VRDAGLHVTVHAGEAAGPQSVRAAVEHLGAERIGHGVRSAEDPALLEEPARRGVTLEVALTSNTQTGAASGYRDLQIHALPAAGVPVTLNTDSPRVSDVTLSRSTPSPGTPPGGRPPSSSRWRGSPRRPPSADLRFSRARTERQPLRAGFALGGGGRGPNGLV